ncbi:MAG: lysophospholipid acyltransferase family protein [Pseudomonadota bacterium]
MGLYGLVGAPALLLSRRAGRAVMVAYDRAVFALLRAVAGVRVEVRGVVPRQPCVVAAKHQSQLDVYLLFATLPTARFVMKASLARVPIFGWYTRRIGCVTVDRGRPGQAGRALEALHAAGAADGQIVVYPQGTRIAPGAAAPYRRGAAMFAETLALPIVPAATNAGVFWSRTGRLAGPGTAVVEFLAPLPAGLDSDAAMAMLEREIEAASARLLAEATGRDAAAPARPAAEEPR